MHYKREYLNRQIRNTQTKKLKTDDEKKSENNTNENEEADAEAINEIMEKITNAHTNLSKNEWFQTYDLRVKDVSEIKTTRNAIGFFKKWSLFKNSSVYVLWDFQKLTGSYENNLSENWTKFFNIAPKYVNENTKDKKTKTEMTNLLMSLNKAGNLNNDEDCYFEGIIYCFNKKDLNTIKNF